MILKVQLNSIEDVVKLVSSLEYYECEACVQSDCGILDAISVIGLIGIGMGKILTITINEKSGEGLKRKITELLVA